MTFTYNLTIRIVYGMDESSSNGYFINYNHYIFSGNGKAPLFLTMFSSQTLHLCFGLSVRQCQRCICAELWRTTHTHTCIYISVQLYY